MLYKLDDLIRRAISGKNVRHPPLENVEGTWQTIYAVWRAIGQFMKEQWQNGKVLWAPENTCA